VRWSRSFKSPKEKSMIYKFSEDLTLDYQQLKKYVPLQHEVTKEELIEKCSGEIDYHLLQSIKELEFLRIGRTITGELYIV
jgi:hypothetical protein